MTDESRTQSDQPNYYLSDAVLVEERAASVLRKAKMQSSSEAV